MNFLEIVTNFLQKRDITFGVILFRFMLSFLLSSLIGWERASRRQIAGLRTHVLICVGSTALMMLSIWIPVTLTGESGDPGRIAAQVVSGIGFLGGGAILRFGSNVRGLTTAASIWVVSALGLLIGAGMYGGGIILMLLTLFTLTLLGVIEHRVFPMRQNKYLDIFYSQTLPSIHKITEILSSLGIGITSRDIVRNKNGQSRFTLLISIPENANLKKMTKQIQSIENVEYIELR